MAVRAEAAAENGCGKMKREDWPKIGTQFYFVCEHFYDHGHKEYVICSGKLTGYNENGRLTPMRIVGPNAYGYMTPFYYKPQEIGSIVFYSEKEAAQLAKQWTDHEDKVWGAMEPPMRRPWEHLMEEANETV